MRVRTSTLIGTLLAAAMLAAQTNQAPIAHAGGPYVVSMGTDIGSAVLLDASASFDPDGPSDQITAYKWDTDNDGLYGEDDLDGSALGAADAVGVTVMYSDPRWHLGRTYTVFVIVVDSVGLVSSPAGTTIQVVENQPPVANAGSNQTVRPGVPVSLDGSASWDADGNTPLTYSWTMQTAPTGSTAVIEIPTSVTPTVTPDLPGDYSISLVVTDSLGLSSEPDAVIVSTTNSTPVAAAGPDQAIILCCTPVTLDGSGSYDLDGDTLAHFWNLRVMPEGSTAELTGRDTPTPTFTPDVRGTYEVQLVVSDPWSRSEPDTVLVSFDNVTPIADPGDNQTVPAGTTVHLDGSRSSDANGDPLTFRWTMPSLPAGSGTSLSDATDLDPTFMADLPGVYVVSLIVSDGLVDSNPGSVTVTSTTNAHAVTDCLTRLLATANGIPPAALKNPNLRKALTNKISSTLVDVEASLYAEALAKLEHDIGAKANGCALAGSPDKNDWITVCEEQALFHAEAARAIELLEEMLR